MNAAMLRVPASVVGDPTDVSVALEVAGALWEKGDNDEAVRWLRRAGEAAGEAGNSERAAVLGQAAGDLQASLELRRDSAPEPVAKPIPPTMPAPSSPAATTQVTAASRAPAPHPGLRSASKPPPLPQTHVVATGPSILETHGGGRIRVSVKTSVRDPGLLLIRPLGEGQTAPGGTREAFLVLSDADDGAPTITNGGGQ